MTTADKREAGRGVAFWLAVMMACLAASAIEAGSVRGAIDVVIKVVVPVAVVAVVSLAVHLRRAMDQALRTDRPPAVVRIEAHDPDTPPEFFPIADKVAAALSPRGFGPPSYARVELGKVTGWMALFHDPNEGTVARAIVPTTGEPTIGFQTRFADETEHVTVLHPVRQFARNGLARPKSRTGPIFFEIDSIAHLLRVHEAAVGRRLEGRRDREALDLVAHQRDALLEDMERHVREGSFVREGRGYRAGGIGLWRILLRALPPASTVRVYLARREAARALREADELPTA